MGWIGVNLQKNALDSGGVVARISGQKRNVARRLVKLIDAAARARRGGGSRGESAREA